MYTLSGVTKDYRKGRDTIAALRGVNAVIPDGEWLAIQGPTGQGPDTTLATFNFAPGQTAMRMS